MTTKGGLVTASAHNINVGNLLGVVQLLVVHGGITSVHKTKLGVDSVESGAVVGGVTSLITKDLVHLFEGKTLGLGNHEEDEGGGEETDDTEEDEGAVVHGFDHVGSGLSDSEVVEPVRRGTDRDTLCSDTEGEDFSDEDPCARLKEGQYM